MSNSITPIVNLVGDLDAYASELAAEGWLNAANGCSAAADEIEKLRDLLLTARNHIATLGGDTSGLVTRAEAQECSVDMIQWEMLRKLDEEIAKI